METVKHSYFIEASSLALGHRGHRPLSEPFSMRVPMGALTALVGPNGSGKSTFIHALIGERLIVQGELKCCGKNLKTVSPQELNGLVAILPQQAPYPAQLRVQDYLATAWLGQVGWFGSLPSIESQDPLGLIDLFHLRPLLKRRMGSVSSGERQKIFLARALVQSRQSLLLDEPTNHLDPGGKREFWKTMLFLKTSREILISTHDLDLVESHADWVVAFGSSFQGLVFSGTKADFFKAKILKSLFGFS